MFLWATCVSACPLSLVPLNTRRTIRIRTEPQNNLTLGVFLQGTTLPSETPTGSVVLEARDPEKFAPPDGANFCEVRDWQVCILYVICSEMGAW
jgi:hypothetical protein